jgi:hypothetical protein
MVNAIEFDESAEPTIAIALDWTNIAAQAWVKENNTPMLVREISPQGLWALVLIFKSSTGHVSLQSYFRATDMSETLKYAREHLKRFGGY